MSYSSIVPCTAVVRVQARLMIFTTCGTPSLFIIYSWYKIPPQCSFIISYMYFLQEALCCKWFNYTRKFTSTCIVYTFDNVLVCDVMPVFVQVVPLTESSTRS